MQQTIKDTAEFYKKHKYCVIRNFIPVQMAEYLYAYAHLRLKRVVTMVQRKWPNYSETADGGFTQPQCPGVYSCYGDPAMETLLTQGLKQMQTITGLDLIPTYSYWRLYKNGDVLKRHKDRVSCEVSTTLFLGHNIDNLKDSKKNWQDYQWPMWVDESGDFGKKGKQTCGDPYTYYNYWYRRFPDQTNYLNCYFLPYSEPAYFKNKYG